MGKLALKDIKVAGKRVLMRVDFNVPLDPYGSITDDTRIRAALESILFVLNNGGSLVLMSHLGRPKGQRDPKLSLQPCAELLSDLIHRNVVMAKDCVGEDVIKLTESLQPGQVVLLENLRFHAAETKPETDPSFAKQLARLGDVYVNDAFGTAHRKHSSTYEITKYLQPAAAGFLMEREILELSHALDNPKRPFYAIIGGAKVSSKIGVLKSLIPKLNGLMIGGGMAYTFFKGEGIQIGDSICENDLVPLTREIRDLCHQHDVPLYLPQDVVISNEFTNDGVEMVINIEEGIPLGYQGMDIGPHTVGVWRSLLQNAGLVLWNGPVGVFEFHNYARGTFTLAHALAELSGHTIVGGGDSVAAVNEAGVAGEIDHICTGGGAALEYLEKGTLPGIEALSE